jgi:two-component system chemotaxis sensor kinase CheA
VRRSLRIAPEDVTRTAEGEAIVYDGNVIPFVPLARALGQKARAGRPKGGRSAIVVDGAGPLAAIDVGRLDGVANVVVRPLPALAPSTAVVAGVALDADGRPRLVLDPVGLVADAVARAKADAPPEAEAPANILVVDDSLTTRMMERSILESAGYEVELATSGEEGLAKARERRHDLYLVDVEMPGIDGFTFIEQTRADPELRKVPAILVTSRSSPADRQRGADVGASGYVVKGDFDQKALLATIRALVKR